VQQGRGQNVGLGWKFLVLSGFVSGGGTLNKRLLRRPTVCTVPLDGEDEKLLPQRGNVKINQYVPWH